MDHVDDMAATAPADSDGATTASGEARRRGATVGRYVVLDHLGEGGMAVVYAAYDPELDRKVALKFLRSSSLGSGNPGESRARVLREAQAMARLAHPNVVAVHDVGVIGGSVYLAMELVGGGTLGDWVRAKPRKAAEIVRMFVAAGRGLAAAHDAGLVHRDFKPANVLVGEDERPRVSDFGLARSGKKGRNSEEKASTEALTGPKVPALALELTQPGGLLGTPAYMAPEQMLGETADARSDQFSFCVALYEAVYGERPFEGDTPTLLLNAISDGRVKPPPPNATVPRWLRRILLRGLSSREARYPSMHELLSNLTKRRFGWPHVAAAGALIAITLVVASVVAQSRRVAGPSLCKGADQAWVGVWDDGARHAVRQAFEQARLPYGTTMVATVERDLDTYKERWVGIHTEACEATRIRGEQSDNMLDRQMVCLDGRLRAARALVEELQLAEAAGLSRAVDAVGGLPAVDACADRAALAEAVAPPSDRAIRDQVDALRSKMADLKAKAATGGAKTAQLAADAIVEQAAAIDYPPVKAEALLFKAKVLQYAYDLRAAAEVLKQAFWAAESCHHGEVSLLAALDLTYVVGYAAASPDWGEHWARHAEVINERTGGNHLVTSRIRTSIGLIRMAEGRLEDALTDFREARKAVEDVEGRDSNKLNAILQNIGIALYEMHRDEEALVFFERSVALSEANVGRGHVQTANALRSRGTVLALLGRRKQALADLTEAQRDLESALGPNAGLTCLARGALAFFYQLEGDYDRSLELYLGVNEAANKALGPTHHANIEGVLYVAELYLEQHQLDEALATYQLALERVDRAPSHNELLRGLAMRGIARVRIAGGRPEQAIEQLSDAVASVETALGKGHFFAGLVRTDLGEALVRADHVDRGVAELEAAVAALGRAQVNPFDLGRAKARLAWALRRARRDPTRASDLESEAEELLTSVGPRGEREWGRVSR